MSTQEIAKRYVELCKKGQFDAALEMFSEDAVSVEAGGPPGAPLEARGRQAIIEKGKKWGQDHEIHKVAVDGPWPNGDRFIVRFDFDVTNKPSKQRIQMVEAALFTVANGKIVREEFFYSAG